MNHVDAGKQLEKLAGNMKGCAESGRSVGILSRISLEQIDEFGNAAGRQGEIAHQEIRQRPDIRDEGEVAIRVKGQLAGFQGGRNGMRRDATQTEGIAIGRSTSDIGHADVATAATDVLDHPLLARDLTHLCAEQSRQDVGRAARRKRIDVFHWLGRPGRLGSRLTAENERSAHNGPERADRFSAGVSPCRTGWWRFGRIRIRQCRKPLSICLHLSPLLLLSKRA